MAEPLTVELSEEEEKQEIELNDSDEVINAKMDRHLGEAKSLHDEMQAEWEKNDKYFNGDHWDVEEVEKAPYKSDVVLNMVFPAIINNIGLMTDSRPKIQVFPAPHDDPEIFKVNQEKAKTLQRMIDYKWDVLKMPFLITQLLYNVRIYGDGFLQYFWDEKEDDIGTVLVRPHNLYVSPLATSIDDADYIIVRIVRSRQWIKDNFPDKADEVKPESITPITEPQISTSEPTPTEQIVVEEYWTDEMVVVRSGKIILKKEANPNYNFDNKKANFFNKSKKPFVRVSSINTGGEFYSRNHLKQVRKVQQTLNKRKAQLDDSLNVAGNPKVIYNNLVMTEEEANKITNAPQCLIGVPGPPEQMIKFEGGQSPPPWIVEDLRHSQRALDDIMMQHDITRGAKEISRKTATESSILREADQTLIRLLVRNLESALEELSKGWVQLMKLYYTKKKYVKLIGEKETFEYFALSRNDIDSGIEVILQTGSTLPTDKNARRSEDIQLAMQNKLSLLSLYETLEKPDPRKHVKRLFAEMRGQLEADEDTSMIETKDFQMLPDELKKAVVQWLLQHMGQNPIAEIEKRQEEVEGSPLNQ